MSISMIFCTIPDEAQANVLARELVEEKLAACVKVIPKVAAVYRWEEKVISDTECQLIIKTTTDNVERAYHRVLQKHPYDVPEWLVVQDVEGSDEYLTWIRTQTL